MREGVKYRVSTAGVKNTQGTLHGKSISSAHPLETRSEVQIFEKDKMDSRFPAFLHHVAHRL